MTLASLEALGLILFIAASTSLLVYARKELKYTRVLATLIVFVAGVDFIPMNPLYAMIYCAVWILAIIAPWVTPRRKLHQRVCV